MLKLNFRNIHSAIILSVSTDISLRQFSKHIVKIPPAYNHIYSREVMTAGNSSEAYRGILSPPFPIIHR